MPLPPGTYPEPDHRPFIRVLRVPPGPRQTFIVLSHRIYGYDVHYVNQRYKPCTKHLGLCHLCQPTTPSVWAGFVAVLSQMVHTKHLLHITPGALTSCDPLKARDGNLRGLFISAWRKGQARNSLLLLELSQPSASYRMPLPLPEVNVPLALSRWWDCDPEVLAFRLGESDTPCV